MKKKIVWIIVGIIVIGAMWLFMGQRDKEVSGKKDKTEGTEESKELDQRVLSFTIDGHSPKGAKQWHLEGNSAEIIGDEIHLDDLKAVTYGEDNIANLTSNSGIYYKDKAEVELIGDVRVVSDDGVTLTTERARWSQVDKKIYTDTIVHIDKEGMNAVGRGGMADSEKKTASLHKDVHVNMAPHTDVTCDGPLNVKYSENVAIFYNNVIVKDKDGIMFSDKLTVNFDPDKKEVSEVVGEGNVKIKRGKSYTLSEKVIYTGSTKSATLIGKPRVIIDAEELAQLEEVETSK